MMHTRDSSQSNRDTRAVTVGDSMAGATLVVIALLLGGSLGAGVLLGGSAEEQAGPPQLNFTYQHFDENGALIVTLERGGPARAGNLLFSDGQATASWAAIAGANNSTMVTSGSTIQLSQRSAFGNRITTRDRIEITWTDGNQTKVVGTWQGGS